MVFLNDVVASQTEYEVVPAAQRLLPKRGNFEDWAYSAAWTVLMNDGTLQSCNPVTYPLETDGIYFTGSGNSRQVNALPLYVEMSTEKKP